MAGLIAIAKSFGNPKKGRKKKREMVKKKLFLKTVMALKDRCPNPFLLFFNEEGMYIYHVCNKLYLHDDRLLLPQNPHRLT